MEIDEEVNEVGLGAQSAKMATSILFGRLINFVLAATSFIIVVRLLGPTDYGVYTLIIAMMGIFSTIGDLGISTGLTRFISSYVNSKNATKIPSIVSNGFFILIVTSLVIGGGIFLFSGQLSMYILKSTSDVYLIQIGALATTLAILYNAAYSAVIGLRKNSHIISAVFAQSVFQAGVSIGLAVAGFGAAAPLIGLIVSYIAGLSVVALIMPKGRMSVKGIKSLISFSLPLGISAIVGAFVNNFALIALGFFVATSVIGNFGPANKTGGVIDIVIGSIGISVMSSFSVAFSGKWKKKVMSQFYNYSLYLAFVLICPVLFFIALFATPFSYAVFGGVYSLAPTYITVLCIGLLINIIAIFTSYLFISTGKIRWVLICGVITSAAELILMPLLLPTLTGLGLSLILFLVPPIIGAAFYTGMLNRVFGITLHPGRLLKVLAANIVSFLLTAPIYLLIGSLFIPLLATVVAFEILVYPVVLARMKGILKGDVDKMRGLSRRIPVVNVILGYLLDYTAFFIPK